MVAGTIKNLEWLNKNFIRVVKFSKEFCEKKKHKKLPAIHTVSAP